MAGKVTGLPNDRRRNTPSRKSSSLRLRESRQMTHPAPASNPRTRLVRMSLGWRITPTPSGAAGSPRLRPVLIAANAVQMPSSSRKLKACHRLSQVLVSQTGMSKATDQASSGFLRLNYRAPAQHHGKRHRLARMSPGRITLIRRALS